MNTPLQQSNVVRDGEGIFVELGDHRAHAKVTALDSNGAFLLSDTQADMGGGVPPHIHLREDETFYILSGRFRFLVGEATVEVGPGDTVYGPRNIVHAWQCISPEGGRLLIMFTPGDNFQSFAMAMAALKVNPQSDMADPARVAEFVALAAQHGIEMLPPSGEIK
jgi:quercetin dioxygenase-like cupin family protein